MITINYNFDDSVAGAGSDNVSSGPDWLSPQGGGGGGGDGLK